VVSDLVFIAFPNEQKAEEVREKLLALQKEYLIELGDAVIVKDDKGRVKLNQMMNLTAAGALSGGFWGMLIGHPQDDHGQGASGSRGRRRHSASHLLRPHKRAGVT
jgi:hypothetical protein